MESSIGPLTPGAGSEPRSCAGAAGAGELVWDSAGEASIANAVATAVVLLANVIVFSLEKGGPNVSASKPNPLLPRMVPGDLADDRCVPVHPSRCRRKMQSLQRHRAVIGFDSGPEGHFRPGPVTLEVADGLGSLIQKVSTFGFLESFNFLYLLRSKPVICVWAVDCP